MDRIRFGTWNVQYASASRNVLRLARLRAAAADIWVLTETHDDLNLSETHTPESTDQRSTGRAGGRWTTIWTRWPVVQRLDVADRHRTVAVLIDTPRGALAVYGTVLPWQSDPGPDQGAPAKGWTEQDRVLAVQLEEWRGIRERLPDTPLIVAGDFNMNLGGKHYCGTARGRKALREGLAGLGLACATETERLPAGALRNPPIDHVVVPEAWMPRARVVSAWEGTDDKGTKLSDHSGLVVEIER